MYRVMVRTAREHARTVTYDEACAVQDQLPNNLLSWIDLLPVEPDPDVVPPSLED